MYKGKETQKAWESSMNEGKEALKMSKTGELISKEEFKINKSCDEDEQRKK